ncbi:MAG: carotenoid oxygenase family protein [Dehalococcoidia bacterium]|jgi:carotenoid cleavage dioxygenase-like enzyme
MDGENITVSCGQDNDYALGFSDQVMEWTNEPAILNGSIPDWLTGTLYRNGPARFNLPDGTRIRHWFDGFAMVHRLNLTRDRITYTNRFLDTDYYRESMERGTLWGRGFSGWRMSPWKKLRSFFQPVPLDNTDVHFAMLGQDMVALTEVTQPVAFDPETLETKGHSQFDDKFKDPVMGVHIHQDPVSGGWLDYMVGYGRKSYYHIFRVRPGETRRELVASLPVEKPAYMHSFAVTKRHAILVEPPFRMNPLAFLFGLDSFIDSFHWEENRDTTFRVVDLLDGSEKKLSGHPLYCYHNVNAFEDGNKIILDLISYPDASVVHAHDIDRLTDLNRWPHPPPRLERFTLDLSAGTVSSSYLSETLMELPRINYERCNGMPYQYCYAIIASTSHFSDGLVKRDSRTGREWKLQQKGLFPSEPVFVPRPGSTEEDDGVVLSTALCGEKKISVLLVLDAKSFTEMARAELPQIIPFGFHGVFNFSSD